jgi:hypothetical protein
MELGNRGLLIVPRLILCRRHVTKRFEQPAMVEPIDPLERREFHGLEMAPRSLQANDFGFEEADHRLGHALSYASPRVISFTEGLVAPYWKRPVIPRELRGTVTPVGVEDRCRPMRARESRQNEVPEHRGACIDVWVVARIVANIDPVHEHERHGSWMLIQPNHDFNPFRVGTIWHQPQRYHALGTLDGPLPMI